MVEERSLIPDDLLRQIIAVGQVDLLVGLPALEYATDVREAVQAARSCFRTHFPRERVAILAADRDAAPLMAADPAAEASARLAASGLRTVHKIRVTTNALPDEGGSARQILAAADLLQARAVVVLDPSLTGITADRIAGLAQPVITRQADLVAPVYHRAPDEGLLVTQLLRPLVRAIHGRRLHEPLIPEFACSAALAGHCTAQAWSLSRPRLRSQYWITAEALSGPFTVLQRDVGPRQVAAGGPAPKFPGIFASIVGSVFTAFDDTSVSWLGRTGSEEVPMAGDRPLPAAPVATALPRDPTPLLESFAGDVQNLREILIEILGKDIFAAVLAAATAAGGPSSPDTLWADTLARFVVAFHHGVMRREHVTSALLPLYLARTGHFIACCGGADADAVEASLEALGARVEDTKPRIIERWANQQEVAHG